MCRIQGPYIERIDLWFEPFFVKKDKVCNWIIACKLELTKNAINNWFKKSKDQRRKRRAQLQLCLRHKQTKLLSILIWNPVSEYQHRGMLQYNRVGQTRNWIIQKWNIHDGNPLPYLPASSEAESKEKHGVWDRLPGVGYILVHSSFTQPCMVYSLD